MVDMKNTKAELFEALKNSQDKLKAANQAKLNPVAVKTAKRKAVTQEKVRDISVEGVNKSIETLETRAGNYLQQLREEYEKELGTLTDVRQAISDKQTELEEIFGIEVQAETLAALIQTQVEKREAFATEIQEKQEDLKAELETQRTEWESLKADQARAWNLKVQEEKTQQDRDMETFKYDFQRQRVEELDQLKDALKAERTTWNDERIAQAKALHDQKEEIDNLFTKHDEIITENETLKAQLETDVLAATESAKKRASQSYGIETNALKKTHEASLMVKDGQITSLTSENDRLNTQVNMLQAKLDDAYGKVQGVAVAALEAQGSAATVNAVKDVAQNNSTRR